LRIEGERILVTGGLGFIGRHLVRALVDRGASVVVFDKEGRRAGSVRAADGVAIVQGDLGAADLAPTMRDCTAVLHLAASADVRVGEERPAEVLRDNVLATARLLEAMAAAQVTSFGFASTSTVYGEPSVIPTPETYEPLAPVSVYGASKLAGEGLIHAFASNHACRAAVWRFANVVGPGSRGVVRDFVDKLRANPSELKILGRSPGTRKSYVHIEDAIDGMLRSWSAVDAGVHAFNIGSEDAITVEEVANRVCEALRLGGVPYRWTGGVDGGGWRGDVRAMALAVDKLRALGWRPRLRSAEAVARAAKELDVQR